MRLSRYGEGEPSRPDAAADAGEGTAGAAVGPSVFGCSCKVLLSRKLTLPRKEVIQPHVPVRLPCYDFTPLTLHTFGTSPPRGLGRRLRVQTTRVV